MVDIIANDGSDVDITAAPGDRVFVSEGVEFLARILAPVGPVEVNIDGTVRTDDFVRFLSDTPIFAVDLEGAGADVVISTTGVVDAMAGIQLGASAHFVNDGTVQNTQFPQFDDFPLPSMGVVFNGVPAAFENNGVIGGSDLDFLTAVTINASGETADGEVYANHGEIRGYFTGIDLKVDDMTFKNTGSVSGFLAANIEGQNVDVVNTGTMEAVSESIQQEGVGDGAALVLLGSGSTLKNSGTMVGTAFVGGANTTAHNKVGGTITAVDIGIELLAVSTDAGRDFPSNSLVRNDGLISLEGERASDIGFSGSVGIALADFARDSRILNNGTIEGADTGVFVETGVENNVLVNNGLIESTEAGQLGRAVYFDSYDSRVVNTGTMIGEAGGVFLRGEGNILRNKTDGVIEGTGGTSEAAYGVGLEGRDTLLANDGEIRGTQAGVKTLEDGGFFTNTNIHLINRGVIENTGVDGFVNSMWGVHLEGAEATIENSGTIRGTHFAASSIGDGSVIINSGLIEVTQPELGGGAVGMAASTTAEGVLIDLAVLGASGTILLEGVALGELDLDDVVFTAVDPLAVDDAAIPLENHWGQAPLA